MDIFEMIAFEEIAMEDLGSQQDSIGATWERHQDERPDDLLLDGEKPFVEKELVPIPFYLYDSFHDCRCARSGRNIEREKHERNRHRPYRRSPRDNNRRQSGLHGLQILLSGRRHRD